MDNFKSSDDVLAAINDLANGIPEGGGEEQERYSFPEVLPDPVEQYLDDDGRQEVDRLESDAKTCGNSGRQMKRQGCSMSTP